jgi:hypothetical protein
MLRCQGYAYPSSKIVIKKFVNIKIRALHSIIAHILLDVSTDPSNLKNSNQRDSPDSEGTVRRYSPPDILNLRGALVVCQI